LIIQLLKVAIGLAFGAYFVWWSLEVLDRLIPDKDEPTAVVGRIMKVTTAPEDAPSMWTLAYGRHEGRWSTHGYELDARGRDGGGRRKLAARVVQLKPTTEVEATSILPPRT
jgi:hypothetical protein